MHHHEGQEVNFQDLMVLFSIHCHVRVKEEDTSTSTGTRKTSPYQQTGWVFDSFDSVVRIKSVWSNRPVPCGPYAAKHWFIAVHHLAPVLLSPLSVFLSKSQLLGLHLRLGEACVQPISRAASVSPQGVLDMTQANGGNLLNIYFDVTGSCPGMFHDRSIHNVQGRLFDDIRLPWALFPGSDRVGGAWTWTRKRMIEDR